MSFRPPLGLQNRHIQSVSNRAPWRRRQIERDAAELRATAAGVVLDCGDGIRLQGIYSARSEPSRGLVVLLHGWEGCADSSYMLSAGAALHAAGFDIFRLNLRDHGGTFDLNEELFHSCRIGEVVSAVRRIDEIYRPTRMALVGQSLGGNFAVRVAARAPDAGIELARVFAIGPVLKPVSTMRALEEGLWIYRSYFLRRWRQSLLSKAAAFPHLYDFGDLRRFRTLTETTDYFVTEYTEFTNLGAYLDGYKLTGTVLADLAVPTRLVLAADDPVIPSRDVKELAPSPYLEIDLLDRGGHCGFVDNYGLESWIDREIVGDLRAAMR
jgi:predicted alpha/beta-fold hydrolase